ncbi:MAG: prepilin peptidase, partial [archaeon]
MDFKKREVYDFFSGSLIFIGLFIRLFTSLVEWNFKYFYLPLIYFIFVFGITYILYKFGQWGGGDSKILMVYTISASYLPTLFGEISIFYNSLTISSFIQFIILTMFVGMFYTIIWMLSNFLMNFKKGFKLLFGQLKKSYNIIIILSFFVSLFFVNNQALLYYYLLLLFIFLIINIGIIVEDNFMNKYIKAKDLTEGD